MVDSAGQSPPPVITAKVLAERVKAKREAEGQSLRSAASALGMSAATLSRVESGTHLPERDHLLTLARWAGIPLDASESGASGSVHAEDASTVEAIELHLRADKDLDAEDAEILVRLMRTAYEQMSSRRK